jgi:hypothetical protein
MSERGIEKRLGNSRTVAAQSAEIIIARYVKTPATSD